MARDRRRLAEVLQNLLDNAVQYTPSGGGITVSASSDGDEVEFTVSDTGIGIPKVDQPRIFERFYRGTDTRKLITGTGLGLYIARKIAVAHWGSLILENDGPAQTVAFCLKLPERRNGS